jgi:hypothetical protein
MGADTSRRTPHKSHPALTAQEAPPQTSDQLWACLSILPTDAEPTAFRPVSS